MANIKDKITDFKNGFIDFLIGQPVRTQSVEPYWGYNTEIEQAKNNLGGLDSVQTMLGQPNARTLEQLQQDFTQGLNNGNSEISQLQDKLGIAKPNPKSDLEIARAKSGAFNLPDTFHSGVSNAPRQGGIINDFAEGFRENLTTPFSSENLAPDKNKSLATRFGEGAGTALRWLDKPSTRGLLVGATALALGGGLGDGLAYGLTTTVGRQNKLTKNKAYRDNLQKMGYAQEEIDAIPGLITDDIYNNFIKAKQLEDNAEYRNIVLKNQQDNAEALMSYRQAQLDAQNSKNAQDRYYKDADLQLKREKLAVDKENAESKKKDKQTGEKYKNPKIILDNVEKLWKQTPQGTAIRGTSKAKAYQSAASNALGFNNNNLSAYLAIAESMVTPLARQIAEEKGNVSDRDIERARKMLPQASDSYEQGMAKIRAVRNLLKDLSDDEYLYSTPQASSGGKSDSATQVGRYQVRVK